MDVVKALVQSSLEAHLYDLYGHEPDFVPYAEQMAVRKN